MDSGVRAGCPESDLVFPLNSPDNLTQAGSDAKHRDIVTSVIDCYLCPAEILMNILVFTDQINSLA